MIKGDRIQPGATVIDAGINRIGLPASDGPRERLVGDVDFEAAVHVAGSGPGAELKRLKVRNDNRSIAVRRTPATHRIKRGRWYDAGGAPSLLVRAGTDGVVPDFPRRSVEFVYDAAPQFKRWC